jgi:hypothetical protein
MLEFPNALEEGKVAVVESVVGSILRVEVVGDRRIPRPRNRMPQRESQPSVVILSEDHSLRKPARFDQCVFADHNGRRVKRRIARLAAEVVDEAATGRLWQPAVKPRKTDLPVRECQPIRGAKCRRLRETNLEKDYGLEEVQLPFIVGIEEGYEVRRCLRRATVAGCPNAAVLLSHESDAVVSTAPYDLSAPVRRSIVDDDELEPGVRLRQNGV